MRHDALTGQAAKNRPDVNNLRPSWAFLTNVQHDTSGTRRRDRRAAARAALKAA